jgi:DNA-binding NtrC family response regulator
MGRLIFIKAERWFRRQPAQAETRLSKDNAARVPGLERVRHGIMAETILLVDDDPLQAYMCKALLDRRFSNVKRVSDAAEALCLVEQPQFAGALRLVISRDRLPGIGGPAFIEELQIRMPGLPVLVLGDDGEWPADARGPHLRFLPGASAADQIVSTADQILTNHAKFNGAKVA